MGRTALASPEPEFFSKMLTFIQRDALQAGGWVTKMQYRPRDGSVDRVLATQCEDLCLEAQNPQVACICNSCARTVGWETEIVQSSESHGPAILTHEAVKERDLASTR